MVETSRALKWIAKGLERNESMKFKELTVL